MILSDDIKKLNITDKFVLLEQLWEDMSSNVSDDRFTPKWHLEVLQKIEEKEHTNELNFSSLEEAKKRLQTLSTR